MTPCLTAVWDYAMRTCATASILPVLRRACLARSNTGAGINTVTDATYTYATDVHFRR